MVDFFAIIVSAIVAGLVSGITSGVSIRVSNTIANPTRPRRRKPKITLKKIFIFLMVATIVYFAIKAFPYVMALI